LDIAKLYGAADRRIFSNWRDTQRNNWCLL
jgi:hypothetical protein